MRILKVVRFLPNVLDLFSRILTDGDTTSWVCLYIGLALFLSNVSYTMDTYLVYCIENGRLIFRAL